MHRDAATDAGRPESKPSHEFTSEPPRREAEGGSRQLPPEPLPYASFAVYPQRTPPIPGFRDIAGNFTAYPQTSRHALGFRVRSLNNAACPEISRRIRSFASYPETMRHIRRERDVSANPAACLQTWRHTARERDVYLGIRASGTCGHRQQRRVQPVPESCPSGSLDEQRGPRRPERSLGRAPGAAEESDGRPVGSSPGAFPGSASR